MYHCYSLNAVYNVTLKCMLRHANDKWWMTNTLCSPQCKFFLFFFLFLSSFSTFFLFDSFFLRCLSNRVLTINRGPLITKTLKGIENCSKNHAKKNENEKSLNLSLQNVRRNLNVHFHVTSNQQSHYQLEWMNENLHDLFIIIAFVSTYINQKKCNFLRIWLPVAIHSYFE